MGYRDEQLYGVVQPVLQVGEQVRAVAFAERGMPFWGKVVCLALTVAAIPLGLVVFVVWYFAALKNFVVALSDRRLIVIEVSGLSQKQVWDYPLPLQGRAWMRPGGRGLHAGLDLDIQAPRPFYGRFLNSSPTNLQHANVIGQTLQAPPPMMQAPQLPQHAQPGGWPQNPQPPRGW